MASERNCPTCGQLLGAVETCCSVSFWCDKCQQQYTPEDIDAIIREEHKQASCCGD